MSRLPKLFRLLSTIFVPALALTLVLAPSTAPAETLAAPRAAANSITPAILDDDPAALLGLGLEDSFARFGAPASVAAVRGDSPWQDDVAFVYGTGYTLFLYGDRLWQLRFTKPYAGSIYGLFLGDGPDKALSTLGQPYESGSDFLLYRMPFKSYPVRLRLVMQDDKIGDVYLYRADF
jgi:hypothetical protein